MTRHRRERREEGKDETGFEAVGQKNEGNKVANTADRKARCRKGKGGIQINFPPLPLLTGNWTRPLGQLDKLRLGW